jgi:hypothetical protein
LAYFPARVWLGPESNRRHVDFQSTALPTELPSLLPMNNALLNTPLKIIVDCMLTFPASQRIFAAYETANP